MTTPDTNREPGPPRRSRRANGEGTAVYARKDGRFEVRIRYTDSLGKSARKSVMGKTAKEARAKAEVLRKEIAAGKPAETSRESVSAYAELWITTSLAASDRAKKTKSLYASLIRSHIIGSALGAKAISALSPRDVEKWLNDLRDKDLSDSSVQSIFGCLSVMMDTAVRDKLIASNPVKLIKRPRIKDQGEPAWLSPDHIAQLLDIAYNGRQVPERGGRPGSHRTGTMTAGNTRYASVFELALNTGLRRGELLGLRWSDIDFAQQRLHVARSVSRGDKGEGLVVGRTKSRRSKRYVEFTVGTERVLRNVKARQRVERIAAGPLWHDSDYVFTTQNGTLVEPRNVLRALQAAVSLIDREPGVTVHSLRHSFASMLIAAGAPEVAVAETMGHSKTYTTRRYEHISPELQKQVMAKLSGVMG